MPGNSRSLMQSAAAVLLLLAIVCAQTTQTEALRGLGCKRSIQNVKGESVALDDSVASGGLEFVRLEAAFGRQLRQGGGGSEPTGLAAWNPRVHGYTAGLSIGVLMPATAIISRSFREFAPAWFYVHAPLGIVAVVGGILGVIFGAKLPEDGLPMTVYSAHKALGVLAIVLAGLQITAIVLRPKSDHPQRYIFNHVHHNIGRLALAFGIVATFLGLKVAGEAKKFYVGYGIVVAVLAAVWLAKEALDFVRIAAHNRRMRKDGFEASPLPGGYPMNGGFAATFMHRRPARADTEAALPHGTWDGAGGGAAGSGGKAGFYAASNPGSRAELLKSGGAASSASSLHQSGGGGGDGVELQRF